MAIIFNIWNGARECMNWIAYQKVADRDRIGDPNMIIGVIRLIDEW